MICELLSQRRLEAAQVKPPCWRNHASGVVVPVGGVYQWCVCGHGDWYTGARGVRSG